MPPTLQRHFGLLHATALNFSMMVGAGVFLSIPLMLKELPGPYALLGWLGAGLLMVMDGLVWAELGAMMPGSGGSYLYLLEAYGPKSWGRLMAFLFVWQFLISGPLEVGSALIGIAIFAGGIPGVPDFDKAWSWRLVLSADADLAITVGPARLFAFVLGMLILVLLYRRITAIGKLTIAVWIGVLAAIGWILFDGMLHSDLACAFDTAGTAERWPASVTGGLGQAMILAMYSYLGYYNVCYVGDEVREPGKTIPRAILISALLACVLYIGLHLAMLGTVRWTDIPTDDAKLADYSLPAVFMEQLHGETAAAVLSVLLMFCCFGSAFAALLGYSRIPYGAAHYGHFFRFFDRVHPQHRIPHVALLFVGALTLFWSFFDLQAVINALITTRIVEQFVGQVIGVMILRKRQPDRPRPYRIWLYPLPCLVALVGWLYLYLASGWAYIVFGAATLAVGVMAYVIWSSLVKDSTAGSRSAVSP